MAQNWAVKQTTYVQRLSNEMVTFLASADRLTALYTEYVDDFYGTGGANALTDAAVQSYLPAATAALVASAAAVIGGTGGILPLISTDRGYLEMLRP